MTTHPELPPSLTERVPPLKPHPIDIALAALSEVATDLLASGKPSRFAELQNVTTIAMTIQQLRPMIGVDDADIMGDGVFGAPLGQPIIVNRRARPPYNDGADLNREIIMLAQNFLATYMEAEKKKAAEKASRPEPDVRLDEVTEMAELFTLRLKLAGADQEVPREINVRIDHLLKRIGEPPHEPEPDPVVSALDVRGHPPDGAGDPDGGRVGEPLAERAGGDAGAG